MSASEQQETLDNRQADDDNCVGGDLRPVGLSPSSQISNQYRNSNSTHYGRAEAVTDVR